MDDPCRVVRCLIKNEVETDKELERIFCTFKSLSS